MKFNFLTLNFMRRNGTIAGFLEEDFCPKRKK
jgi:hypothetical protein